MASQTDQRATDFEEVKKILAQQPRIKLVQTEGEPPDCYQLEYLVEGLVREEDGSIGKAARHVVLITLPFGYPHFPPAVRPMSPIFHPDIDPDAIRVSSHWLEEPSLAKLLPYIGEMLCGKIYSLEEPFNQEAADWYANHAAELPLDTLEGADMVADDFDLGLEDIDLSQTDSPEEAEGGLSLELETPQPVLDIVAPEPAGPAPQEASLSLESAPEEETIQEDFDLDVEVPAVEEEENGLELELGEPVEAAPPQDFGPKLKEIRSHVDRREMTIAGRLLAELPPALPEAEELRQKVKAAQEQCEELLQALKLLEDEDNFPEAEKVLEKLKKVAVDTPGLAEIGRRLQQSQSMLDTFSLTAEEEPEAEPLSNGEKKKKSAKEPPAPPKPKKEKKEPPAEQPKEENGVKKTAKSRVARAARREIPVAPFAAALVGAAVIGVGGLMYTRDSNMLVEAEQHWQSVQSLVKRNDFQGANDQANLALGKLKTVITPFPEKSRLRHELDTLQANEEFQRGLKGEAKYKDKYLPIAEVKKREQLDKLTAQADQLKQQNHLGEAAAMQEKAADLAAGEPAPLPAEVEYFKEQARQLRLQEALANADQAEQNRDWEQAVIFYDQALKFCKTFDGCDPISKKRTSAVVNRTLDQARNFGDAHAQWQELLEKLNQVKDLLAKNPELATPEKQRELDSLFARSQFYQLLSQAGEAYGKGSSAAAVSGYRQALALLKDKQNLFAETERSAADKISRTANVIEISVDLNEAAAAEQQNDLAAALRQYKEAQTLLRSLGPVPDEGLRSLARNVDEKISSLSSTAEMKRKMAWLEKNYRRIFSQAYPQTRPELLSKPGIILLKHIGEKELYTLTCLERSYVQLELRYLYNPDANQWTPCPECQ